MRTATKSEELCRKLKEIVNNNKKFIQNDKSEQQMKKFPTKAILLMSLLCISSSAMSDFRDREMGERYRERHKNMDICAEIKEDLLEAEQAYVNYSDEVSSLNQSIDNKTRQVSAKESVITRLQSAFNQNNSNYTRLRNKQKAKVQLLKIARQAVNSANVAIPAPQANHKVAKDKKEDKCDWRGSARSSCRRAKRDLEHANNILNPLINKRNNGNAQIQELSQIDAKVANSKRALNTSTSALKNEQNASPTLG